MVRLETDDMSIVSTRGGATTSKGGFGLWSARSPTAVIAFIDGNTLNMKVQAGNHAAIPFIDTKVGDCTNMDIENKAKLTFDITNFSNGNQKLNISGSIFGDHFPAGEGFVTDAKGNLVFLGVSDTGIAGLNSTTAPYVGLAGDGVAPMASVNVSIIVNEDVQFVGVLDSAGKMISIKDWNASFEKQDPNSKDPFPNAHVI